MESEKESDLVIIKDPGNTKACLFCHEATVDEINLGPMHVVGDVVCHYYCMLMSAALSQNGTDDEGILGFMPEDIQKEARRARRLKCSHCNKGGASVGCCRKSCKHVYHFPCGLRCGVNYQFYGNYEAFCKEHATPQTVQMESREWKCPICLSVVTKSEESIASNCCKGAIFHKACLKAMALNAGYFFKCPMCNSTDEFKKEMRHFGIFVPEQDASWEREPNAFEDLLFQYSQCDATDCLSVKGRDYNASKGGFMLARCRICGAAGIHRQCGKLKTVANWACNECTIVENKTEEERLRKLKENKKSRKPILSGRPQQRKRIIQAISDSKVAENYMDENEEQIDLKKVKMSRACKSYFPYNKQAMSKFQQSQTTPLVPDWRGLVLRTNVVDWLGHYVRNKLKLHFPPPRGMIMTPSDVKYPPVKLCKAEIKTEVEENTCDTATGTYPTFKKGGVHKKKRHLKSSKWQRGVLSKRKGNDKKHLQLNSKGSTRDLNPLTSIVSDNYQLIKVEPTDFDFKDLKAEDNVADPAGDDHVFKAPYPVKKRHVLELSHFMQVDRISQDMFVQSNIEITDGIKVEAMNEDDVEIGPLGTLLENVKPGDDDSVLDVQSTSIGLKDGVSDNLVSEENESMESQLDENELPLTVLMDHTYSKKSHKENDSLNQYVSSKCVEKSFEQESIESESSENIPESEKSKHEDPLPTVSG